VIRDGRARSRRRHGDACGGSWRAPRPGATGPFELPAAPGNGHAAFQDSRSHRIRKTPHRWPRNSLSRFSSRGSSTLQLVFGVALMKRVDNQLEALGEQLSLCHPGRELPIGRPSRPSVPSSLASIKQALRTRPASRSARRAIGRRGAVNISISVPRSSTRIVCRLCRAVEASQADRSDHPVHDVSTVATSQRDLDIARARHRAIGHAHTAHDDPSGGSAWKVGGARETRITRKSTSCIKPRGQVSSSTTSA